MMIALHGLTAIAALVIFHILYSLHRIDYPFINIVLLILSPAGYLYRRPFSYMALAGAWALLFPLFFFVYRIDIVNAALPLLIFSGMTAGFNGCRVMMRKTIAIRGREVKYKEAEKADLSGNFEELSEAEDAVRNKELVIVNLYEATKKMSASLTFEDIFRIFSTLMKDHFTFLRSELVILKTADGHPAAGRSYHMQGPDTGDDRVSEVDYGELVRASSEHNKAVYITRQDDAPLFDRLKLGQEADSIMMMPFLSGKKTVAVLAVENLPQGDFERLVILAAQFSLEMKKILLYEKVEEMAITDGLTGLYVRRYFLERLDEELSRSRRHRFNFAFLMCDIDNFKHTNDTYGHLVGDVVLKEAARIMKGSIREIDLAARYGGEEFSMILPETDAAGALVVAERIRKKIEDSTFKAYDESIKATISIGIAMYPEDAKSADDLIERSDAALYKAKRSGKNVVCAYGK